MLIELKIKTTTLSLRCLAIDVLKVKTGSQFFQPIEFQMYVLRKLFVYITAVFPLRFNSCRKHNADRAIDTVLCYELRFSY